MFHYEKERQRGDEFENSRYFIRHTGKYHIIKAEKRQAGNVGCKSHSAEVRLRAPIGNKFSISAGAIYRTHEQAFGYNPIEIWLNETEVINGEEFPAKYWYEIGFLYGYDDIFYSAEDELGKEVYDWYWKEPEGKQVANSALELRNTASGDLRIRDYN